MVTQRYDSAMHYACELDHREKVAFILELMEIDDKASDDMWEYFYENMDIDYVTELVSHRY